MKRYAILAVLALALSWGAAVADEVPPLPKSHTQRDIEGWTVHIDDRLLSGTDQATGDRALRLFANRRAAKNNAVCF